MIMPLFVSVLAMQAAAAGCKASGNLRASPFFLPTPTPAPGRTTWWPAPIWSPSPPPIGSIVQLPSNTDHRTLNEDTRAERGCDVTIFNFTDCFFSDKAHINRTGLNYQGDYIPRDWAQTTMGYEFEDENGFFNTAFTNTDPNNPTNPNGTVAAQFTHGLRINHALFAQQRVTRGRFSVIGGLRYVHNESFGDRAVPRAAVTFLALRGGNILSGTRLRFGYAQGIKEPRFEESFGISGVFPSDPNPKLKPEENRAFEAGFEQSLLGESLPCRRFTSTTTFETRSSSPPTHWISTASMST